MQILYKISSSAQTFREHVEVVTCCLKAKHNLLCLRLNFVLGCGFCCCCQLAELPNICQNPGNQLLSNCEFN